MNKKSQTSGDLSEPPVCPGITPEAARREPCKFKGTTGTAGTIV